MKTELFGYSVIRLFGYSVLQLFSGYWIIATFSSVRIFPNLDDVDHTFYGDKPILEFSRFQSWNTMEARVRLIFINNINTISDIISNLKNIH